MARLIFLFTLLDVLCFGDAAVAQQQQPVNDSVELSFRPYASFRGHLAWYNGELEMQENGSRLGFELKATRKNIGLFVGLELQVNMFRSQSGFNVSNNTDGGFIVANKVQNGQVFSSRLGYIGVDFAKAGVLSIGKQHSVYYDITSWTDKFNVFGAGASATYVAGTDGGNTGTGRADQAIIYRNTCGPISIGAQFQFASGENGNFLDGAGGSVKVKLFENLQLGVAYNRFYLNRNLIDNRLVIGLDKQPSWFAAGASYTTPKLELGLVFARQVNGDLTNGKLVDSTSAIIYPSVVFNATGWEFYARYNWHKLSVLGGFNYYLPETNIFTASGQQPLSPEFKRKYLIMGAEYRLFGLHRLYLEGRLSDGTTALATNEYDVLTLGIRLDVEQMLSKRLGKRK